MRETTYSFNKKIFSLDKIKELNNLIKNNFVQGADSPATGAKKTSDIKLVKLSTIHKQVAPFLEFCIASNNQFFGFDLYPLTGNKLVNYNIYSTGKEYSWHIDSESRSPIRDVKLTCLLNCSEENYKGGDLFLFKGEEVKCSEFNTPGSAVVFPSFINHRVGKVTSGSRVTLSIWMWGPKFR